MSETKTIAGTIPTDRRRLLKNGYEPLPILGKAPRWEGWNSAKITSEFLAKVEGQYSDHNGTGLRCGQLFVADIDIANSDDSAAAVEAIQKTLGETPLFRIGSKPGGAHCYYNPEPIGKITVTGKAPGASHCAKLVEFLGQGQQIAAYGTHPDTDRPYEWPNSFIEGDPLGTPLKELPKVSHKLIKEAAQAVSTALAALGYTDLKITGGDEKADSVSSSAKGRPITSAMLESMLACIDPSCSAERVKGITRDPRDQWLKVAAALKTANVIDDSTGEADEKFDGLDLFAKWSAGAFHDSEPSNYVGDEDCAKAYRSLKVHKKGGAGVGSLIQLARANGYEGPVLTGSDMFADIPESDAVEDAAESGDSGLASITYRGGSIFKRGRRREMVVPEWLPAHGLVALLAKRGVGKSTIMIDLALRLASDLDWQGVPLAKGWTTVYVCGEDDEGAEENIRAWCKRYDIAEPPEKFLFLDGAPNLLAASEVNAWAEHLRSEIGDRRAVVFLDTWQRATSRGGQNKDEDMQTAVAHLEALAHSLNGPAVAAFHPPKHDARVVMGSGVIENSTSAIWMLQDDGAGKRLEVSRIKGKGTGNYRLFRFDQVGLGESDEFEHERTGIVASIIGGAEIVDYRERKRLIWAEHMRDAIISEGSPLNISQMGEALSETVYELEGRTQRFPKGSTFRKEVVKMFNGHPLDFGDSARLELYSISKREKVFRVITGKIKS